MPRSPDSSRQFTLFNARPELSREHATAAEIARRIPDGIRFGTSSWSFPGWRGIVFSEARTVAQLAHDGLIEYGQHPLLRTVGVDRSYYAPVPLADWQRYAAQVPAGFEFCTKAFERVVSPVVTDPGETPRPQTVRTNPDFLSVEMFDEFCASPMRAAGIVGPMILQISRVPRRADPEMFLKKLDRFLSDAPRDRTYAIELRDRRYFTDEYVQLLRARGAVHVYNFWTAMPSLREQRLRCAIAGCPLVIIRLLLPPGKDYEKQREAFAPFDKIVTPDAAMRAEVIALLDEASLLGIPVRVLVNNKAEGSSPLTIRALAEAYVASCPGG